MTLYESLLNRFGYNEPFKTSEIKFEDYSKEKICMEMTKLCKEGKVVRFETGIYYIPKTNKFGTVIFNQSKIVEKKYIKDGEQVFGYYSGAELEYRLRLTKVKPNTIVNGCFITLVFLIALSLNLMFNPMHAPLLNGGTVMW